MYLYILHTCIWMHTHIVQLLIFVQRGALRSQTLRLIPHSAARSIRQPESFGFSEVSARIWWCFLQVHSAIWTCTAWQEMRELLFYSLPFSERFLPNTWKPHLLKGRYNHKDPNSLIRKICWLYSHLSIRPADDIHEGLLGSEGSQRSGIPQNLWVDSDDASIGRLEKHDYC